jgi:hypothetical protein
MPVAPYHHFRLQTAAGCLVAPGIASRIHQSLAWGLGAVPVARQPPTLDLHFDGAEG